MIIDRDKAVEKLAKVLAHEACYSADVEGFGWDAENPEDVNHFLPQGYRKAERYMKIIEGSVKDGQ